MAYATASDLLTRFGEAELLQLTDRDAVEAVDGAVVATALADADATIEGYLAGRYAVPVSPVPPLLTRIACDLARFTLHGKAADDTVKAAYEAALKLLRDLSKGDAVLAGAAAAPQAANPAAPQGEVRVAAPSRRVAGRDAIPDFYR